MPYKRASKVEENDRMHESYLLDYMKKHPDKWITSVVIAADIADTYPLSRNQVKHCLGALNKKYPNMESKHGLGYIWHSKIEKPGKNAEGYSDPTASQAIEAIEPEPKTTTAKYEQGSIYSYSNHKNETEYFLVLNQFEERVVGIPVFDKELCDRSVYIPFVVSAGTVSFKGDASEIRTKPVKYLRNLCGICTDQDLEFVRFMVINEGLDCSHLIERTRSIRVDGVDYNEGDIDGMIDKVEDLKAINSVLKKENEKQNTEIESMKTANSSLVRELEAEKARYTKLEDEIEELKAKPAAPAAVEHISACGAYWTKDTIIELVASLNIYREFFDAYCAGLKKGV